MQIWDKEKNKILFLLVVKTKWKKNITKKRGATSSLVNTPKIEKIEESVKNNLFLDTLLHLWVQ